MNNHSARGVGDSLFIISDWGVCSIARSARLNFIMAANLGFRSAPPQAWLRQFAYETAGTIFVPASVKEMLVNVEEIARNVDSQYVVTYKPKRSFASGSEGEYRRVELVPRRVGLVVSSRRGYVTPSGKQ